MATIDIRNIDSGEIDCIVVSNELRLIKQKFSVRIFEESSEEWVSLQIDDNYEEIDNLIKALQKAKELYW